MADGSKRKRAISIEDGYAEATRRKPYSACCPPDSSGSFSAPLRPHASKAHTAATPPSHHRALSLVSLALQKKEKQAQIQPSQTRPFITLFTFFVASRAASSVCTCLPLTFLVHTPSFVSAYLILHVDSLSLSLSAFRFVPLPFACVHGSNP